MAYHRTDFAAALRPFSLVVALATCSLGVSLAIQDGAEPGPSALLLILAGLLLQAGVNLLNDHADLSHERFDTQQRRAIARNYRLGWLAIVLASAIGLWFVWLRGWPMLALGVIGVFGGWSYAAGPANFKARGLGVVAVFFLTGVLMVGGAYYAMLGTVSAQVLWLSLPFSLFASLLLLSNELRDYERDRRDGHGTFTVRFGYDRGVLLYRFLVLCLVATTLLMGLRAGVLWLPLQRLRRRDAQRATLTRLTGRCYLTFALVYVSVLWVPPL